jgi:hypothetical protein
VAPDGSFVVPSFDNSQAARELCIRRHQDGMGSKAKPPQSSGSEIVTSLCSVNSTGLVFLATRRLKVCSDVTLSVQTSTLGSLQDWTVQGWVVECRTLRKVQTGPKYQITLLFSGLPAELRAMLIADGKGGPHSYPVFEAAPMFGLN